MRASEVEVNFLAARDGEAVFGRRAERPEADGLDYVTIDRGVDAGEKSELADLSLLVDERGKDHVAFGAGTHRGEVGRGVGEVPGEGNGDLAFAPCAVAGDSFAGPRGGACAAEVRRRRRQ